MNNLSKYIDHTLLSSDTQTKDIERVCFEAIEYSFSSVCINPHYIPLAFKNLKDTDIDITTVIGFPLGASFLRIKVLETRYSIKEGANEIDAVLNISEIKNNNFKYIENEIKCIQKELSKNNILKLILETSYLTKKEIVKVCEIAKKLNVDYVKTSTGFGKRGATIEDIEIMKRVLKDDVKIKASGGIKNIKDMINLIDAGANRIGTSSSVKIMLESQKK